MGIIKLFTKAAESASNAIGKTSKTLSKINKKYQITKTIESSTKKGATHIKRVVDNPSEISELVDKYYGHARNSIISNPNLITPSDLLTQARQELIKISSCILQINESDNEKIANEFGNLVLGKVAGIATTGSLLGLVSTFGTAGTGAAISGLSGAASTSATLAWVGGLLGGGMAAGAVMTGGVGLVAGLAAYKALKSTPRSHESLSQAEQHIVQSCLTLVAIFDDELSKKTVRFNSTGAELLLKNTLIPLKNRLSRASENIASGLDYKYSFIYRNHVIKDYDRFVISEFRSYVKRHSVAHSKNIDEIISKVIYILLTGSKIDEGIASKLVVSALRLSDSRLHSSDFKNLSMFIQKCSPDELKHVACRLKAVYIEMLWIEEYNACHDDSYAEVSIKKNESGPEILIKGSSSRRIRDRWPLIGNDFNISASKTTNKPSIGSENRFLAEWNNSDSSKSALELLARKAGISVAASALTSLLFS